MTHNVKMKIHYRLNSKGAFIGTIIPFKAPVKILPFIPFFLVHNNSRTSERILVKFHIAGFWKNCGPI